MEDPHFEIDEQPTRARSSSTRAGRFVAVSGQRGHAKGAPAGRARRDSTTAPIFLRLQRVEQQHRLLGLLFLTLVIGMVVAALGLLSQGRTISSKTLETSEELKLVDSTGRPRLFLRLHSEVPVMQVLDAHGRPRLTLGLRFDETPFIDLSDESGAIRASLQVTTGGEPTIRMYDRKGESTFTVN